MLKKVLFGLMLVLAVSNFSAFAQKTTVWLVRHAEKSTIDPTDINPELSDIGTRRATALSSALKDKPISTIYTTNYKRTKATVAPLAAKLGLNPVMYDPRETSAFAAQLLKDHAGKEVLVVGHSNTLIPLIKALNCTVPFDTLSDDDYDILFEIVIDANGKAKLYLSNYGEKHHTTAIATAYAH